MNVMITIDVGIFQEIHEMNPGDFLERTIIGPGSEVDHLCAGQLMLRVEPRRPHLVVPREEPLLCTRIE